MPKGYDNVTPTRQSFAFNVERPSSSPTNAQAGFRGGQLVGGESQSGVVQSSPGMSGLGGLSELGGFFDGLMKPYVERKKKELFIKGVSDQMSAVAGEEIRASNGIANKIFGPSSYEEGAIFYSAKDAVNKMQADMLADMDNLKRLPPDELSKVFAERMEGLTTGDQFTDLAVQTSLLEASGPMLQSVAKERFTWQQDTAKANFGSAADSGADIFQKFAVTFAQTSDPSDEQSMGLRAAANNYLTSLQKPAGMTEDSWKDSILGAYRKASQSGNGYAVTALKQSGILNILTDDERVKLEDVELKYGNRSLGDAAVGMADRLDKLNGAVTLGRISPADAMAEAVSINEALKRQTGFDMDLMDYKEVVGAGKSVWSALKSNLDRQQDHQWSLEAEARKRSQELEDKRAEAAQVVTAMAMGDPIGAKIRGIGDDNAYNAAAEQFFKQGNFAVLGKSFNRGYTSSRVKDIVQGDMTSFMGREYTKAFDKNVSTFQNMNKANPAAAAEYYGNFYPAMLNYQRLTMDPKTDKATAFATAFANAEQYTANDADTGVAKKSIEAWITSNEAGFFGRLFGAVNLNNSGKQALTNAMAREVSVRAKAAGSDVPLDAIVSQVAQQVKGNGSFESYGEFGWGNAPGTVPLGKLLKLQDSEAQEMLPMLVSAGLKNVGFTGGDYQIQRMRNRDGTPLLTVIGYPEDGSPTKTVALTLKTMQDYVDKERAGRVYNPNDPKNKPNRVMQKVIAENRQRVAARDARPGTRLDIGEVAISAAGTYAAGLGIRAVDAVGSAIRTRISTSAQKRAARKAKRNK